MIFSTMRRRTFGGLLSLAIALVLTGAVRRHITPTVVLQKQADVIRTTVPDAKQFFLKTVKVGKADFTRIHSEGGFDAEEDEVKFYYGSDASGELAGVVVFPQVNTQHGPLEVGLTMRPDGTIRDAVVTKATVETKPWVLTAIKTGLMNKFEGMRAGDDPSAALRDVAPGEVGKMPSYMAGVVAEAVERGLVLYDVLYPR